MAVLYTLTEVANLLQVSVRSVQRLIASGRLRAIRVGRLPRISDAELDAYLASQRRRFVA
jgi:excisionase family DNA binding protein